MSESSIRTAQAEVLEAAIREEWQPSDCPLLDWHQALRAGAAALRARTDAWHTAWAVQPVEGEYKHPCIFGTKADAVAGMDRDERVVQIEYRVLPSPPSPDQTGGQS